MFNLVDLHIFTLTKLTFFLNRTQLIYTVEKQLLSEHLSGILAKGLDQLLEGNRLSDLSLLYSLFSRVKNGTVELCSNFNSYIKVRRVLILINFPMDNESRDGRNQRVKESRIEWFCCG